MTTLYPTCQTEEVEPPRKYCSTKCRKNAYYRRKVGGDVKQYAPRDNEAQAWEEIYEIWAEIDREERRTRRTA